MGRSWKDRTVYFVGSCAYAGAFPRFPGTFLSALTALWLWFAPWPDTAAWTALASTAVGLLISPWASHAFGKHDSHAFVLDELAGMAFALWGLPADPGTVLAAFVLFRFFDIKKPLFIRSIDRWRHPASVMLDDVAAGVAANACLWGFYFLKSRF